MAFESVDALQRTLADTVFKYAADRKKAAGRALGTLVEVVTFYTLRAWEFRDHIVIERSVPEFGNPHILHNVEFSLHPVVARHVVNMDPLSLPITPAKIRRILPFLASKPLRSSPVVRSNGVKRNACVLAEDDDGLVVANVDNLRDSDCLLAVCQLHSQPFAIFECKRVGVEEGMKKGPQTIEKAKQGAYVARTVSSLQKVRLRSGDIQGMLERSDGTFFTGPYDDVLREAIERAPVADMQGFILTVGVVSNHGNWFTSSNPNKEMRVLAQSYDWLLFLTDSGLSQFIEKLLLRPSPELAAARQAFLASYSGTSGANRFTKVQMDVEADEALRNYFSEHEPDVESWFNVVAPAHAEISALHEDLRKLAGKEWRRSAPS